MSVYSTNRRNEMPSSSFALPGEKKYPIEDMQHAGTAKAYAKQEEEKGKLSESGYRKVVAKANAFQRAHGRRDLAETMAKGKR